MNKLASIVYNISVNKYTRGSDDIKEHIMTLYRYANECNSVFETGVRGCISSFPILYGLVNQPNQKDKPRFFMNDIDECDINELLELSKEFNIDVKYEWINNLNIQFDENETYDMTFIDTWHVYGQLKRELEKFSKITNKYLIMHDTTVDEIHGESLRGGSDVFKQSAASGIPVAEITQGLGMAIDEFLKNHPEWYLKEKFTNNNGLTILAKRSG